MLKCCKHMNDLWPSKQRRHGLRLTAHDVLRSSRYGNWQIQLGGWSTPMSASSPSTPDPESADRPEVPLLGLPFDVSAPTSPASSEASTAFTDYIGRQPAPSTTALDILRGVRDRVVAITGYGAQTPAHRRRHHRHRRGVLFFLPAIFAPAPDIELGAGIGRNPPPYTPTSPWIQRPEKDPQRFVETADEEESGSGPSRWEAPTADSSALVDLDEAIPRRSTGPTPPRSRSGSQQRI